MGNWGLRLAEPPTVVQETQIRLIMEAEVEQWLVRKREAQRIAAWVPPPRHERIACHCRVPRGLLAGDVSHSVLVCQTCHLPVERPGDGAKAVWGLAG